MQKKPETKPKEVSVLCLTLGVGSGGSALSLLSSHHKIQVNSSFKILFEIFLKF